MRNDTEGKRKLVVELNKRFHAMKTYGKEPESLESITQIFCEDLADYPAEKVVKAIKTHSQRSQEFPTVADLVGLIKRNGKPPLSKELYISISKKDGEDRTNDEWQYLRDYESQAHDEEWGSDRIDRHSESNRMDDRKALFSRIFRLEEENENLKNLLHEARMAKGLERPVPTQEEKIKATVEMMRRQGMAEQDVSDFLVSMGLPSSYKNGGGMTDTEALIRELEDQLKAGWELSTWAACINWRGGRNESEWLDELRQKIDRYQSGYKAAIATLRNGKP